MKAATMLLPLSVNIADISMFAITHSVLPQKSEDLVVVVWFVWYFYIQLVYYNVHSNLSGKIIALLYPII